MILVLNFIFLFNYINALIIISKQTKKKYKFKFNKMSIN